MKSSYTYFVKPTKQYFQKYRYILNIELLKVRNNTSLLTITKYDWLCHNCVCVCYLGGVFRQIHLHSYLFPYFLL